MKRKALIPLFLTAAFFVGCTSGSKDEAAYRSAADTSSSQMASPTADTLIKDTVMKDSSSTGNEKPAKRGPIMP